MLYAGAALGLVAAFAVSWLRRRFWPGALAGLLLLGGGWALDVTDPAEDGDNAVAVFVTTQFALLFAVGVLGLAFASSRVSASRRGT